MATSASPMPSRLQPPPDAIVFDFDGVLVDSERLHHATLCRALSSLAPDVPTPSWDRYRTDLLGFDDRDAFAALLPPSAPPALLPDLIALKARLFAADAANGLVPPIPPSIAFLHRAAAASIPCALCSGALRSDVLPILDALGIAPCFSVLVTAEDTPRSKPDPAPYRLSRQRLLDAFPSRLSPAAVFWAVEDTPDGLRSASAAAFRTLALATTLPPAALAPLSPTLLLPSL